MSKKTDSTAVYGMKLATTSEHQRLEAAQVGAAVAVRQETAKTQDLRKDSYDSLPMMTSNQGLGISDDRTAPRRACVGRP